VLRKARKGGPKSSITLSCSIVRPPLCLPCYAAPDFCADALLQLPPAWLVAALHEHFNVHLLFPSPAPFVLPSDYLPSSFDARRVIFHEKGEGAVHVARVLGGMLIVVRGLEGEELPASDRADGTDEVEIGKLVRDVRSFVSDIVVVRASEGDVDGAKVVEGWTALAALLGLEGGGLPL
jgi:hypothetical protein